MKKKLLCLCLLYLLDNVYGKYTSITDASRRRRETSKSELPRNLTSQSVEEAFAQGENAVVENRSTFQGRSRTGGRPSSLHHFFQASCSRSRQLEEIQGVFEEATRILAKEYNLDKEQICYGLAGMDLKSVLQSKGVQNCEAQFSPPNCNSDDKYRTLDGTCNNPKNPSWGMAASCFGRLVCPDYADGVSLKRNALSGSPLPPPRKISLEIHSDFDSPTIRRTHMFIAFGQFLGNDVALAPLSTGPDGEDIECCPGMKDDPLQCDPILIKKDDPFFGPLGINCLSNTRTSMCPTCTLGPRQQTNQITAFIDCSQVYGLSTEDSRALRNLDGSGTLKSVNVDKAGELPPGSFEPDNDQCSFQDPEKDCFQTGDVRSNQHPALTSFHVLFLREHNRIAKKLKEINPKWNEEMLFQETRRIVGAEMQMITYNEFLPQLLGQSLMRKFKLKVLQNGYTKYERKVDPTVLQEFSTAAYRFGHSMINSFFPNSKDSEDGEYLKNLFQFPFGLYGGELEGLVEGLTSSPSQKFDRYMIDDVTNYLYQFRGNNSGIDLASLNINRGRDHGIPGYTTLLELCGGPKITRWRQLDKIFQPGLRQLFQKVYESPEDIDLFSGGLAEANAAGAVVGPTFACIIGIQFYRLKYGDRFYFEHGRQAGSFTPDQLTEIRKRTLGNLICDNSKIMELPERVFEFEGLRFNLDLMTIKYFPLSRFKKIIGVGPGPTAPFSFWNNPVIRCNKRPQLNFTAWEE